MKQKQTYARAVVTGICMIILIFDSRTAVTGAYDGIILCINTVIPSLFPFFVLCLMLTGMLSSMHIPMIRPLGRSLSLPENGEILLMMGFLAGYPAGAQCIRQAYTSGALSRTDAQRMLPFCSNAGPAFIFGMGLSVLGEVWICWLLWFVHILSALIVGWISADRPLSVCKKTTLSTLSLTEALNRSLRIMATVCGWIILFRIIHAILQKWFLWMLPHNAAILLSGLLELSNGSVSLLHIESIPMRFVFLATMLGFGGVCVTLQTAGVLSGSGLSIHSYVFGKIIQSALSCAASILLALLLPEGSTAFRGSASCIAIVVLSGSIFLALSRKTRVAFRKILLYNDPKMYGGSTYEAFPQKN